MKTVRTSASLFGLIGLAALTPGQAFAQQEGDTAIDSGVIIVTAQRRAEAQVDVPISITNLSSDALRTSSVNQLADIGKVTPALRFDFAGGFFQPTIRGIGTAVTTSGGGGNVGIYIDGFYSPNPLAADFDLISVESIQVLKGPQGTLFGRNTTGGAILVSTKEPSVTGNSAEGQVSFGRYNELQAEAFTNYVISDRVAMTIEGMYRRGDGWQHDISNNKRRVGDYRNWSVRLGLKAELSDSVDVLLRYKHGDVDDPSPMLAATLDTADFGLGAPFGGIPGTYTTAKNRIASGSVGEFIRSNSDVLQATIKADLGFADLTSYSQYRNEKSNMSQDLDYSGLENITAAQRVEYGFGPAQVLGFQLGLPNNNETWSQELLLTSKPGTPLQWTAGLFYFENTDQYITFIDNFGNDAASHIRLGGSSTTSRSYAAFADATYEVTPRFFITAGARYSKDKIVDAYWNQQFTAVEMPVPDISNDKITPRVVLRYKPTRQTSVYASFTKGYKAAILDVGGSCQTPATNFVCNDVQPEDINAYEIGFKYEDRGLSFETAAFYYDYKNLQVSIYRTGTAEIINAATSEIYGLEGSLQYKVTPAFSLSAGASYVHARYKTFNNAPVYTRCTDLGTDVADSCAANGVTFLVVPATLKNVTMQRTPEFTGFLGGRYETRLGGGDLALSGNLFYSSSFFFGPSGVQFKEDGYATLALRGQWTAPDGSYYLALFGDNVTDSRYMTQAQYSSFGIGANWSKPATYGVEFGFNF
ncbi:TonB-dependent receptor [Novosphingobium beihaiensis]|uniref:TonB-dependent receptor n=1 Tax=Novosphingobium beihaiensis TaxID=2930389 RepID=A0ABT0BTQ0_9SPHN|nr:TonB-dependent receptor [Novosphingobium beihaiensis]MCJ2188409.1 TonB-dependent receptor [Novosphingobium beihaiensis]